MMQASYLSLLIAEPSWNEWVPDKKTSDQLEEIKKWLMQSAARKPGTVFRRTLKPGYRTIFFGPPGSGKKRIAAWLGQEVNKPVYKIDLSKLVSKYIGETEKNLARVFDEAKEKGWILFFDEADALFGKRSDVKDAHDRYANQQTAYLLQRLEDFPGLVILATNMKSKMDEAFTRRFQSVIHFKFPQP